MSGPLRGAKDVSLLTLVFRRWYKKKNSRSVKDEKEKEFKVREGQNHEKKQNDKTEKQKKETTSQLGS